MEGLLEEKGISPESRSSREGLGATKPQLSGLGAACSKGNQLEPAITANSAQPCPFGDGRRFRQNTTVKILANHTSGPGRSRWPNPGNVKNCRGPCRASRPSALSVVNPASTRRRWLQPARSVNGSRRMKVGTVGFLSACEIPRPPSFARRPTPGWLGAPEGPQSHPGWGGKKLTIV
jgi:hypothetical protein